MANFMPVLLLDRLFRKQNGFNVNLLNLNEKYDLNLDFSTPDQSSDMGSVPFGCLMIHECITLQSETFRRF